MSSGHIPHSFSLPFNNFLTSTTAPDGTKYTTFKQPSDLDKEIGDILGTEFTKQVKAGERSIITTCGSGMTAGGLWLGLRLLDVKKIGLYDEVGSSHCLAKLTLN